MLKSLLTLVRGTANDAAEATIDHKALVILDQQIRDCGAAVNMARKALAIAIAQERQEQGRLEKLAARIGDLEARATQSAQRGPRGLGEPKRPRRSPRWKTSETPGPRRRRVSPRSVSACAPSSAPPSNG